MSSPAGKKTTPRVASTGEKKTPKREDGPAGKKTTPQGTSTGGNKTPKKEEKKATPRGASTGEKKTPNREGGPAGKKTTPQGTSTGGYKIRKEGTTSAGKKSTQEGASPGEKKTKKGPEGKSSGFESSPSKSQIDFNELKNLDKFKEWFWEGNNAKDLIIALNNFSFRSKQFDGSFVRYEKHPARIYGVMIENVKKDQNDLFWNNINELGLKLVKIGFTQKTVIEGSGNRMEFLQGQLEKDGRFETSIKFTLVVDFTTAHTLREEEQAIRSKVGIELDKDLAKFLNLPVPTEWVMTTETNIKSVRGIIYGIKNQPFKDRKMYTTKDVEQCDFQIIEELVKKVNAQNIAVKDGKVVLLSSYKPNPSQATPEKVHQKLEALHESKEP